MPKKRSTSRSQLIKTLDQHPAMPVLLRSMPPRTAASLFQRIGIADAAELMTLMPSQALLRTLDESIWKSARPGARESVDVIELIEWLQTWHDIGVAFLLERLAAMSDEYLVVVLSCLLQVDTETGEQPDPDDVFDAGVEERPNQAERFGPFDVYFMHEDSSDVARATVHALWADTPERLLRMFGRMSHAAGPPAAHRGWVTTALDVEFERESFREARGYVSAAGARAFLAFASDLTFEQIQALTQYDLETARQLSRHAGPASAMAADVAHPVHASQPLATPDEPIDASNAATMQTASLAALQTLLEDAELIEPVSEQLRLSGPSPTQASAEVILAVQLRRLAAEQPQSFQERARELAYLANVLKVAVSIHGASLSDAEAKDAAFATCNLGVELAPSGTSSHLQGEPGLIRAFLFGWCTLHRIAARIVATFDHAAGGLSSWIRDEAAVGLQDLRSAVTAQRWPEAREAMVFLTIAFDTATCRALGPLLDEIPRYSLLLEGSKLPDAARWIASRADLDRIAALLAQLAPKRSTR